MSAPLLRANQPCEIEGRNFRRGYREPQIGKVYTIQFEVDKDTWDACELVPKTAIVKGVLWWESEDGDSEKPAPVSKPAKRKEPSGPYAYYWERMCAKGIKSCTELEEVLDCTFENIWEALHEAFKVETMSNVSPRQWEVFVKEHALSQFLIDMSRQAEIEAAEKVGSI